MAKAKKLPSGNWVCQAYLGKDKNGKVIRKAFTAPTKKQAEYLASEYLINNTASSASNLLFKDALKQYIDKREAVLSPATIRGYRQIAKHNVDDINDISIDKLTQEDIQNLVNKLYKDEDKSPKTVRNVHGLIVAVLDEKRPNFKLHTVLPAKRKPKLHIPSNDEVVKVISYIRGIEDNDLLIAVLLAAYGPMRRSEVCALTYDDIKDGLVHVNKAMVHDTDNNWVIKPNPKSEAGDRYIQFPDFVMNELKGSVGRVVNIFPDYVSDHFASALRKANVEHFRYHDLRHYSASIQHALGVPDAYIMQRGGWKSDKTLKDIYRHALDEEAVANNNKINDYFSALQK